MFLGMADKDRIMSNLDENSAPIRRSLAKEVRIVEVGPRDGLQNEKNHVSTDLKVALVNRLQEAGCTYIEVGAFVNPKAVPRMADSARVFKQIHRSDNTIYAALTPNLKVVITARSYLSVIQ